MSTFPGETAYVFKKNKVKNHPTRYFYQIEEKKEERLHIIYISSGTMIITNERVNNGNDLDCGLEGSSRSKILKCCRCSSTCNSTRRKMM